MPTCSDLLVVVLGLEHVGLGEAAELQKLEYALAGRCETVHPFELDAGGVEANNQSGRVMFDKASLFEATESRDKGVAPGTAHPLPVVAAVSETGDERGLIVRQADMERHARRVIREGVLPAHACTREAW